MLLLAACLIAIHLAGCTSMESWRSANGESTHSAKSKSMVQRTADRDADENENDEDEDYGDSWKHVGDESSDGLAIEERLDPWFGKYNYADKGREIERSLR